MRKYFSQKINLITALFILLFAFGCHREEKTSEETTAMRSEVTIVHPQQQTITEYLQFNGVTQFQKKNNIRSTNTGYITSLLFKTGDRIQQGTVFCTINTKEQQALKNISSGDSSLSKFQKPLSVISNATGVITAINVLQGDYISEGDVLATASEPTSLIVVVNVPYENHQFAKEGSPCELVLSDGKIIATTISGMMPSVETASQSQAYFIRLPEQSLPENLNVILRIPYKKSVNTLCIATSAVQTDELQKNFWLMKVVHDSIAVKVSVQTGLRNDSLTEITSNNISLSDNIISLGAYGLTDSTHVIVKK
jgi:biotin carboxyl carrier protein